MCGLLISFFSAVLLLTEQCGGSDSVNSGGGGDEVTPQLLYNDAVESLYFGDAEDALRALDQAVVMSGYRNTTIQKMRIQTANQLRAAAEQLGWRHKVTVTLPDGAIEVEWVHGQDLRGIIGDILRRHNLYAEWQWILLKEFLKYEENSGYPWLRAHHHMPDELKDEFTLSGQIPVEDAYLDDGVTTYYERYTRFAIEAMITAASRGEPGPHYRETDLELHRILKEGIVNLKDMRVFVGGSLTPWYESVALHYGAKEVVTVEYNTLEWDHDRLVTMTNAEFEEIRNNNPSDRRVTGFDVAFSISSYEHDGLGRYGDPLDPNGDLRAMHEMSQIVKPGGHLILAVPFGPDLLAFNAHRVYGQLRMPMLIKNWTVVHGPGKIDTSQAPNFNSPQPIFVLENTVPKDRSRHEF